MQWIEHRGKAILFADYSGINGSDLANVVNANQAAIIGMGKAGKSDLLVLTDVSNCLADDEAIEAFKSIAVAMRPYTRGSAIVGISGLRKFALEIVNLFSKLETKPLDTVEKAKDWLSAL